MSKYHFFGPHSLSLFADVIKGRVLSKQCSKFKSFAFCTCLSGKKTLCHSMHLQPLSMSPFIKFGQLSKVYVFYESHKNWQKSSMSIWRYVLNVISMVKIWSILVAFLENINFTMQRRKDLSKSSLFWNCKLKKKSPFCKLYNCVHEYLSASQNNEMK